MQFLVLAYDANDENAAARRAAARTDHLTLIGKMKESGQVNIGAAIQDEAGRVIGSVLIFEFDLRDQVDEWLNREPYVINRVWGSIDVKPCLLGPAFQK